MVVTAPSGGSSLRFVGSERTPRLRCRRVWGFGKNHRGQLGLGHQQDVYVPKEVTLLREYGAEHPHGLKLTGPAMKRLDLSVVLKEREEKAEKAKQLEKERLAIVQKLERERLEQKSSEESTDEELPDFLQSGSERNDTAPDTKEEEAKSSAKASDTPEGSERPDSGGTHSDKASQLSKKGETARDSTHFDRDAPAEDAADGNPAVLQSLDVLEDLKNVKRNIWDPDGWEHARDEVQDGNLKVLEVSLGADHSLVLAGVLQCVRIQLSRSIHKRCYCCFRAAARHRKSLCSPRLWRRSIWTMCKLWRLSSPSSPGIKRDLCLLGWPPVKVHYTPNSYSWSEKGGNSPDLSGAPDQLCREPRRFTFFLGCKVSGMT